MNYGNMGIKRSVLIRQNDLRDLKSFHRNKIIVNLQKTKMQIFPLYFGEKSFAAATAVFRNCPNVSIAQDDLDSVARFITSKDHLVKNIDSIQYDRISNHGMDNNGTYEHSVQVRVAVRRKNLWEGARSYLWKHLAHDLWERSNGTTITLTRIHVK